MLYGVVSEVEPCSLRAQHYSSMAFRMVQRFISNSLLVIGLSTPLWPASVMASSEASFPYQHYPDRQCQTFDFHVANRTPSTVTFTVHPDVEPAQNGIPQLNLISSEDAKGFPIAHASLVGREFRGYASMYGWIQIFADSPEPFVSNLSTAPWEIDFIPIYKDINSPFTWFGPEPLTLFDAPFRPESVKRLDWVARSFLCYIGDELLSRHPVPIAVFEWGFWIDQEKRYVKELKKIDLEAWDDHLKLFRGTFPDWRFDDVTAKHAPG